MRHRLVYCHCAYAKVIDDRVKRDVLRRLTDAGVPFEAVPDLCEMSARDDPALARLAKLAQGEDELRIAACFPRAVKWLFAAADARLPERGVAISNMRTETAEDVASALLSEDPLSTPGSDDGDSEADTVDSGPPDSGLLDSGTLDAGSPEA